MDTQQAAPRIVEMPAWSGAGLMLDCPGFVVSGIGDLWMELGEITDGYDLHDGMFGISLPLPDGKPGFRYWAVMKQNARTQPPAGLSTVEMPAKRFAVYPFHDHPSQMPAALREINETRLPAAGLQADPAWVELEFYPPDWHDEAAGKFRIDLYVAIL